MHILKFLPILLLLIASGCTSVKQVGQINMISNRNIDKKENYELLSNYQGSNKRQIKRSRAVSVQEAVDDVVRTVPGGEFVMNVKIYHVNNKYFAIEGDVYGNHANANMQGFQIGDSVIFAKLNGNKYPGVIVKILNTDRCIVHFNTGKVLEKSFKDLVIIPKKEDDLNTP